MTNYNGICANEYLKEISKSGINYSLSNIRHLMAYLGNVQDTLQIVHVAGTNGKGSVCAYLEAVLHASGYRVGVFSSPAVFNRMEIWRINGRQMTQQELSGFTAKVRKACMQMEKDGLGQPSVFEVETAIAFCYFKQEQCDVVLLEAGLGGAEDATNVIKHPLCSVLTSISKDHMEYLGNTIEQIAAAKAGIIKPGCPCICAVQKPQVYEVLRTAAQTAGSELYLAETADSVFIRDYQYDVSGSRVFLCWDGQDAVVHTKMTGAFQRENIACALETIRLLAKKGFRVTRQSMISGLEKAYIPGRFERIGNQPAFYIDGGHNEGAAQLLEKTVQNCFTNEAIVYIIGVLADKEYQKVLQTMLPYAREVFTVTPDNKRALDGRKLAQVAMRYHPAVTYVADIREAVKRAAGAAGAAGAVLAFGSFSYLRAVRQAVRDEIC